MTGANGQCRHDTCRNGEKENKRDVRIAWFRGRNHLYYRRSRRFHWAANKGIHFARIICTRTPPSSVGLTTPFRTQPFHPQFLYPEQWHQNPQSSQSKSEKTNTIHLTFCLLTSCFDWFPRNAAAVLAKGSEEQPITANPLISKYVRYLLHSFCAAPYSQNFISLLF